TIPPTAALSPMTPSQRAATSARRTSPKDGPCEARLGTEPTAKTTEPRVKWRSPGARVKKLSRYVSRVSAGSATTSRVSRPGSTETDVMECVRPSASASTTLVSAADTFASKSRPTTAGDWPSAEPSAGSLPTKLLWAEAGMRPDTSAANAMRPARTSRAAIRRPRFLPIPPVIDLCHRDMLEPQTVGENQGDSPTHLRRAIGVSEDDAVGAT